MKAAERRVSASGLRLTPVRRRTLEILLEEHRALGAYDVLDRLASDGFGKQPPVAYRALDFLVENGLAHRIDRLNAFAACAIPDKQHDPVFLICSGCDAVEELHAADVNAGMHETAKQAGFQIQRMNIEVLGLCPSCCAETSR